MSWELFKNKRQCKERMREGKKEWTNERNNWRRNITRRSLHNAVKPDYRDVHYQRVEKGVITSEGIVYHWKLGLAMWKKQSKVTGSGFNNCHCCCGWFLFSFSRFSPLLRFNGTHLSFVALFRYDFCRRTHGRIAFHKCHRHLTLIGHRVTWYIFSLNTLRLLVFAIYLRTQDEKLGISTEINFI